MLTGFVAYLFANNIINGSFWGNERLYYYLSLLLLYFAFKILYRNDNVILKFVFYGLLAGLIIELLTGFGQLFGITPNSDSKFLLGGLFGNPGAQLAVGSHCVPSLRCNPFVPLSLHLRPNTGSRLFFLTTILSYQQITFNQIIAVRILSSTVYYLHL